MESKSSVVAIAPAAFVQERLWFLDQWLPKKGIYNIPTAVRLRGKLELAALRRALDALVRRHEILRTRFAMQSQELAQLIYPAERMPFRVLTQVEERDLERTLEEASRYPFDLARENPIRATLIELGDEEHVLLIVAHHIVSDEWSVRVMLTELKAVYESGCELPALELQYADYAAWQNEWLEGGLCREQLDFWKKMLEGFESAAELPTDRSRPAEPGYAGERERVCFDREVSEAVAGLARRQRTTPYNVLLAVFQALLARYTSSERVLTGTVVAGRTRVETEGLIGFFVNTLPMPTRVEEESTFEGLLEQVAKQTVAAYAHQDVPFDRVVAEINPERSANRMPLMDVLFTIQDTILERERWGAVEVEWIEVYTGTAKFDLNLTVEQNGSHFGILAEYSADLFDRSTIQRFCRHYANLLRAFASDPNQNVWKAEMLDATERMQVIADWNATRVALPERATIDGVFAEQVTARPEAVALRFAGGDWTYRELDERSELLRELLIARGARLESSVGIFLERGPALIQAFLGILKAGGCYVPLDVEYPEDRLRYLVEDAGINLVVTEKWLLSKLPSTSAEFILLDELSGVANRPERAVEHGSANAACLMYTSGSTGKPKGVVVTHRNVVRLVKGANYISFNAGQVFLQYAPVSFDASTLEIWGPLLNGGKLCIMPPQQASLKELGDALRRFEVTTLWLTAGLFNVAVDEQVDCFGGLQQMITGGDAGSPNHFRRFLEHHPNCQLYNGYGPTENTTFTTMARVTLAELENSANVPIGKPIANTRVYILDARLQPVPIGVPGELYAGGDGVARGYRNAPELTAERFVENPFRSGERMYRTGDLARWLPNGMIQFLGRRDHQVKVRGFRVEPGEIEEALRLYPGVREAVVVAAEPVPNEKTLVAYWTAKQGSTVPEEAALRAFLKKQLPPHMVPTGFLKLDSLPLNANGKVDRKALPKPSVIVKREGLEFMASSRLEEQLLKVWREVFSRSDVGLHEDFFDLGGQSLLATRVVSRIRQALNIEVPIRALFDHTTVAELASFIEDRSGSKKIRLKSADEGAELAQP